jgi:hypothetical protein
VCTPNAQAKLQANPIFASAASNRKSLVSFSDSLGERM